MKYLNENWRFWMGFILFGFFPLLVATQPVRGQEKKIDFAHDILPVLKKRCASCHSNGTYKGGFSMDRRDTLLDSGTIEEGDSDNSDLIDRVTSEDPDERMPPEGDPLGKDEIDKLKRWIDEGVDWTEGFSFKAKTFKRPLKLSAPKMVKDGGNPIDQLLTKYFENNKLSAPPGIEDSVFVRRVYLDLLGVLPTPEEQARFLDDTASDKREKLIRNLLDRNRDFADHWMTFWNDLLRNDYAGTGFIDGGRKQITAWLHQSLYENKPYDRFVQELISPPDGESDGFIRGIQWRGRVNASQVREVQFAQNVSQVFLGENLKCASCHDSFINDWKLSDAYGMAAIVSDRPLEMYRCDKPTGKKAEPRFLWPELGTIDRQLNRQQRLSLVADLITNPRNGRFPRTIVNRLWQKMMGRGLIEPVDMMSNRAFDEPLLDFLAQDLVDHQFDLKRTLSLIANSNIYQSRTIAEKVVPDENWVFRGPLVRRMTAEQFMDATWYLTGTGPQKAVARIANYDGKFANSDFAGKWIWDRENANDAKPQESVIFEILLETPTRPESASVVITCDNHYVLMVNGKKVKQDSDWTTVEKVDVQRHLKKGENRIEIIARNLGDQNNPAGLYVSVFVDQKAIDPKVFIRDGSERKQAVPLASQDGWKIIRGTILEREQMALGKRVNASAVRASLVTSDPLMRSLGRPNREQVVTTRVDQLSTLQALDLSNGRILSDMVEKSAARSVQSKANQDAEKWVRDIFRRALCRDPSEAENRILLKVLGQKPNEESLADALWMIIMLPEFQHVR